MSIPFDCHTVHDCTVLSLGISYKKILTINSKGVEIQDLKSVSFGRKKY